MECYQRNSEEMGPRKGRSTFGMLLTEPVNKQAEISFGAAYFTARFHLAACFPFMDSSGLVKDIGCSFSAAQGSV